MIGPDSFELFAHRMFLAVHTTPDQVQAGVNQYVSESGLTVVGYYTKLPLPKFTMLRWPDTRELTEGKPAYHVPTIQESGIAFRALANRLDAWHTDPTIVPPHTIHAMMSLTPSSRGKEGEVALEAVQAALPGLTITEGFMVAARARLNEYGAFTGEVEPRGEKVGIVAADPADLGDLHMVADELLERSYYAVEHGPTTRHPGRTKLYETHWADT